MANGLHFSKSQELANFYLGFNGWSTTIKVVSKHYKMGSKCYKSIENSRILNTENPKRTTRTHINTTGVNPDNHRRRVSASCFTYIVDNPQLITLYTLIPFINRGSTGREIFVSLKKPINSYQSKSFDKYCG